MLFFVTKIKFLLKTMDVEKKRSRGDNWTQEEKDLFLDIMRKSASIIECKLTDTNTNKRKNLEWVNVQNQLKELTGKPRDIAQLKGFWRRGKVAAKKSVSQHRRLRQATGGGQKPPSPMPDELKIMALCPTDFVDEVNVFDSDAVPMIRDDEAIEQHVDDADKTIYDIEEDYYHDIDEIVTVADVHTVPSHVQPTVSKHSNEDDEPKPPNAPNKMRSKPKPNTSKAAIVRANMEFKHVASKLVQDEYKLKLQYHSQELVHQQNRHKLEIELLTIEKELKLMQLQILKKKL